MHHRSPSRTRSHDTAHGPARSPARRALVAALVAGACLGSGIARAQDAYPSKAITIVVPYPAGGSNDTFARQIAKELGDSLKQPVVIDNRPGASGNTGTAQVARAAPDGYTLVAVSSSMTTNAAVQSKMPFDPVKGLAPVAMFAKGPFIVAVNNDFPAKTPAELIAAIKAKPGQYNYASSGAGSVNQFGTELLKARVGDLQITHIPYKGMGPAVTDLVGNQTQLLISSGPSLLPMVRSGKLRAVGITSLAPSPIAPELPPMATAVPGYEFELWWGLLAPAGTPPEVVAKLNAAVNQALARPAVAANFLREGAIATPLSPAQFGKVIADDIERWSRLAKQQNITAE
jgi:tripartite-type tricarboxylate transporter receptor subunit TctC